MFDNLKKILTAATVLKERGLLAREALQHIVDADSSLDAPSIRDKQAAKWYPLLILLAKNQGGKNVK